MPGKSRKSHREIFDAIIEVLAVRRDTTVEAADCEIESRWETALLLLSLIIYVQGLLRS